MEGNVPEIRLKGFTGAWVQRRLGDILKINSGRDYKHLNCGDIPVYGTGGYMLSVNDSLSEEDAVGIGRKGTIDKPQFLKAPFWTVDTLFFITPKPNNDLGFLFALSQDIEWVKLDESTSIPSLSKTSIDSVLRYVPEFDEQTAIGEFFRTLDENITLHKCKLDGLRKLKKGYLQKMFPQAGETVPRVRFDGFIEPWVQRKLGDIATITMGQSPDSANYTENPQDHILVQGNADMKNGWVTPRVWTTQVTKTASKGCLIMSVRAPVGDIGKTEHDVVLGRGVCGINGNEFLFQSLGKMKEDGFWAKSSAGTTFESINSTDIKEAILIIPCDKEQTAIGNFFCNLDNQITAQRQKVEQLKQLKAAYLQKMFV